MRFRGLQAKRHLQKTWGGVRYWNLSGRDRRVSLLRTAFGQLNEGVQRVIYRSREPQLRPTPGDVAIQRINLRPLPAMEVLSGRGKRFRHLRGKLERPRQGHTRIFQPWRVSS